MRLPADAVLPDVTGCKGPLSCLSEARYGIVWGAMGAARSRMRRALDYSTHAHQFGRPIGGFQLTQAKLADMASNCTRASCCHCTSAAARTPSGSRPSR